MTKLSRNRTLSKRRSFSAWLKRKMGSNSRSVQGAGPAKESGAVFGVPLMESIEYAYYPVGYQDESGALYRRAGAVPIVVAKTGLYLKKNALHTEGIFRLSGSSKRVNALQQIFNEPSQGYGIKADWTESTVHDAATLMRRFLNQLPDPVIPHKYYKAFRDVMNDKSYSSTEERIHAFQELIQQLPLPHQQLLLYLLDLLNLFARHAADTRMDVCNLAAVFCPAILSHPSHNSAVQYKISQRVIEFLIEFQALFTMQILRPGQQPDVPPPVPALPDCFVTPDRHNVPPLDMKSVHKQPKDQCIDSGTDVKTPASIPVTTEKVDNAPTPRRAMSPVNKVTPQPLLSTIQSSKSRRIVLRLVHALALLGSSYAIYRLLTVRNMIYTSLFFGSFATIWVMLLQALRTSHQEQEEIAIVEEEEMMNLLSEEDKETEEAMLQDESIMAEWRDLMTRAWRNDVSTPQSHLLSNTSDYFPADEEAEDDVDRASMMTVCSRFNEEEHDLSSSSADDEQEGDDLPEVSEEELQRLWQQFQQIQQDKDLAERLQIEEQEAERNRNLTANPFLADKKGAEAPMSPLISPKNTDKETWKIALPKKL